MIAHKIDDILKNDYNIPKISSTHIVYEYCNNNNDINNNNDNNNTELEHELLKKYVPITHRYSKIMLDTYEIKLREQRDTIYYQATIVQSHQIYRNCIKTKIYKFITLWSMSRNGLRCSNK